MNHKFKTVQEARGCLTRVGLLFRCTLEPLTIRRADHESNKMAVDFRVTVPVSYRDTWANNIFSLTVFEVIPLTKIHLCINLLMKRLSNINSCLTLFTIICGTIHRAG